MAGAYVKHVHGSNIASGASLTLAAMTPAAGNSLALIVTYSGATTTVAPSADFGAFTEDVSLQHAAGGGIGMHVFTLDSCLGINAQMVITYGAARPNRGAMVVEMSGLNNYIAGVFPAYQVTPGIGGDAISSGNFNVTNPPNYLLAYAWDQSGGGAPPPLVGASSAGVYTSRGTTWFFADASANARLMDARALAAGNIAATFSDANGAANTYAALLLAFAENQATQLLMSQCMY